MNDQVSNEEQNKTSLTKAELKLQRREEKTKAREKEAKQHRTKKIVKWVSVAVGLLLIVGFISFRSPQELAGENDQVSSKNLEITETDWVKGSRDAKVTLFEYADFQCPACKTYSSMVKQLAEEYGDRIGVVYRHFPLKQIHSNAEPAAIAAEAAGQQGKFWEMHDLLFEHQDDWSDSKDLNSIMEGYAQELELDIDKFKQDLKSDTASEKVDNQYRGGLSLKINSTPTFFLNDKKLDSVRSYEQFKKAIEDALGNNS